MAFFSSKTQQFKNKTLFLWLLADYKIVKHCFGCRKRFVVNKGESKKNYCDACQEKYYKELNKK